MTFLLRLWNRVPVLIRAVVAGLFVSTAGHVPGGALFLANLRFWPSVPWSAPLIALYLWFFWQYASGRWRPASTAEGRRRDLAAQPLSPSAWRWSLLAGGLMMSSLFALHFVAARLFPSPYGVFIQIFKDIPPLTIVVLVIALSAVAGIVEEAAFRGFMHTPIERAYGPAMAIIIVGLLFVLAHYGDGPSMTADRIFFVSVAALGYGIMRTITGSILPGLVLHAVGDAVSVLIYLAHWAIGAPPRTRPPGWTYASQEPLFWLFIGEAIALAGASAWCFVRLIGVMRNPLNGQTKPR